MPRRWLLLPIAVVLGGCSTQTVLLAASPASPPAVRTLEGGGVSFQYPGNWVSITDPNSTAPVSPSPGQVVTPELGAQETFLTRVGLDELDFVQVQVRAVPAAEGSTSALDAAIADWNSLIASSGGKVLAGPDPAQEVGLQGAAWRFQLYSGLGYVVDNSLLVVVKGASEYSVLCAHTPASAADIEDGCRQVLASLRIG